MVIEELISAFTLLVEAYQSSSSVPSEDLQQFKQLMMECLWNECMNQDPQRESIPASINLQVFWQMLLCRQIWAETDPIRQIWAKENGSPAERLFLKHSYQNLHLSIDKYAQWSQIEWFKQMDDFYDFTEALDSINVSNSLNHCFSSQAKQNEQSGTDFLLAEKSNALSKMLDILIRTDQSPELKTKEILQLLKSYSVMGGYGVFAEHTSARWKGQLEPIRYPSAKRLDQFIGYHQMRNQLIANTETFLQGMPAHNVLLYGDRGTGKSSSIHALLNEYWMKRLRLVEVSRHDYSTIPDLFGQLAQLPYYFIILLDDLSFESDEYEYKLLKTALEGGAQALPSNVLLYATSNRRHFIKESFTDKTDIRQQEDVRHYDTVQEKMSLSDRFGLVISFFSPTQNEYLDIVKGLADQLGIAATEEMIARALQFEREHSGRSPRVANQFIRSELSRMNDQQQMKLHG